MQAQKQIIIKTKFSKACSYLKNPENLVIWTNFFQKLVSKSRDTCTMLTPLGLCHTRCLELGEVESDDKKKIQIVSQFEDKLETADMVVELLEKGVSVTFSLKAPSELTQHKFDKMLDNLEKELIVLKKTLELETCI